MRAGGEGSPFITLCSLSPADTRQWSLGGLTMDGGLRSPDGTASSSLSVSFRVQGPGTVHLTGHLVDLAGVSSPVPNGEAAHLFVFILGKHVHTLTKRLERMRVPRKRAMLFVVGDEEVERFGYDEATSGLVYSSNLFSTSGLVYFFQLGPTSRRGICLQCLGRGNPWPYRTHWGACTEP